MKEKGSKKRTDLESDFTNYKKILLSLTTLCGYLIDT